jgi:hypothetical protein
MKPIIPDNLIAEVARRNCIAFIGAGLSAGVGLPGWPQLIRQMIDWCDSHGISLSNKSDIESFLKEGKLLQAADALHAKMGDDKYHQFLKEVFLRPDLKPTEVHKILVKIPFTSAGTTNYDSLIEDGYREARPGESITVFTQVDHEQLGTALHAKRYFVLKAHGSIERPGTIVLGFKDYSRLIHRSEGYRTFLRTMFLDRTVLFLGFSMTDPELLLLLEELKEIFEGKTPIHYALMDVSKTTQTEQEQFEENYRVKIIPYTPSAVDHPEVKSFLTELGEKVTQQAIWYQMEEARKAAEDDDPNYQVVFTTDGEFIIKERYPGAAEKNPLKFSVTIKGREAIEAVKRLEATGEPLEIKGEDIVSATLPDIISRYIKVTGHSGISTGVGRGEMKRIVKATIECADGETASLNNIILENVQGGNERAILSNENQDIPWKFRLAIQSGEEEVHLNYTFNDVGLPIKRALDGLRFSRALSKGGFLHFENEETGEQFAHADIAPGVMPAPEPLLIRVLEALEVIQKKTPARFTSPHDVPADMIKNIFAVQQIVETGSIEFQPPYRQGATLEQAKDSFEQFSKGATAKFTQYADDWVFVVLGQHVSLGPVLVTCEKFSVTPEDLEVLRKAIEVSPADGVIEIRMTPVAGEKFEAKLPNWLPAEEREKIHNLQFARTVSLNHFIALLFESAQKDEQTLDIEEFMTLLNGAKDEKSEQGVPLNYLSSATPQELVTAFALVIAGLKPDEKLKLAASLFKGEWLPSSEAAGLAGLDEAIFLDQASKQIKGQKARPAGSDI